MQRVTLQMVKGGIQVNTGGQISTTIVEGSFPSCTVSIFTTGTVNLVPAIYGDNLNPPTLKANPFTADANGFAFFYAPNGTRCDIQLSGTGIVTPFIVAGDVLVDDFSFASISAPSVVSFSATPTFDLSQFDWFQITLTGNVTAPVFTNPIVGSLLFLTIIQNAAGGNTWAWPGNFLRPPAVVLAANAVTDLIFAFDGTNWRHFSSGDAASFSSIVNAATGFRINNLAAANRFLKGDGTNFISGTPVLASADFANQGTTTTVLHGNGAGNPSFAVVTPSDATGNTTGSGNFVLATSPTITTPVITGTPTGTGIPTLTLKKGSGAGNYTGTNTSFADVDATNLAYTVTIPTGWKLLVQVNAVVFISTATATIGLAIIDGSVVVENQITGVLNSSIQSTLGWVINGDSASHMIKLQAKTGTGADAWNVFNDTATRVPTMTFLLTPSN